MKQGGRGVLAAALVLVAAGCGPAPTATDAKTAPPATGRTASGSPLATPPTPRTTPPGTPAPIPSQVTISSATFDPPPTPEGAAPTPTAQPGLWRIEGYVQREDGEPLEAVCVVVGPLGCKPFSPHTDARGHWFLDVAEGTTTFDFYFELPGYRTVWWHVTPKGPEEHNVILEKS